VQQTEFVALPHFTDNQICLRRSANHHKQKGPQNETLGAENKRNLQVRAAKCTLFASSEICVGLPSRFRQ
jgi:hypothetical protein